MTHTTHFQATVTAAAPGAPGAVGLVEGLREMMLAGAEDPADVLSLEEMLCVTSVAFKHYVFDPEINPPRQGMHPFEVTANLFSNFGIYEGLGYYTGWEVREFNHISIEDWLKLIGFELQAGRPVLTVGLCEGLEPEVITGIDAHDTTRTLHVMRRGADAHTEVDAWGMERAQGDSGDFVNWCVIARPDTREAWAASHERIRHDVLRWAVEHGVARKEFFHETRLNYTPGLSGYDTFAGLLGDMWGGLEGDLRADAAQRIAAHIEELRRGRGAAGICLKTWAEQLGEDPEVPWGDGADEHLEEAAQAYTAVGAALPVLDLDLTPAALDTAALGDAVAEARAHEVRALECVARAIGLGS